MRKQVYQIKIKCYIYGNEEALRLGSPKTIKNEITQHVGRLKNWQQKIINSLSEGQIAKFETTVIS